MRLPPPSKVYDPREQAVVRQLLEQSILKLNENVRDAVVKPTVLEVSISFSSNGSARLVLRCNIDTLSLRYAVSSTAAPSIDDVREADVEVGNQLEVDYPGPFQDGEYLYVAVLPYAGVNGDGREGPLVTNSATRGARTTRECRAVVLASDTTTITVQVDANSDDGTAVVRLDSISGGPTIISGPAVAVDAASPQIWVFSRHASTQGEVKFSATFPDAIDDADYVTIPAQGVSPFIFLASRARVIAQDDLTTTVRYNAADPLPQGADSLSVAIDPIAGFTPFSPQLLTPTALFSGTEGSYVDFVFQRPDPGAGTTYVFTLTAVAGNRIQDKEEITIPGRDYIPAYLVTNIVLTETEATIIWRGGTTVSVSINGGPYETPPASPFTVERPAANGGQPITYAFSATDTRGGEVPSTVVVPPQAVLIPGEPSIGIPQVFINNQPGDGGGDFDVDWTEGSMPGTQTYKIEYAITAGGTGTTIGSGFVVDPATKPQNITHPLGAPGVEGVVTVKAYDGATLIAERTFTGPFAF